MRCIFCLKELPPSLEHVFADAIGGRLTTDRVCTPCNSTLGTRVDAALSDNLLVRMRRAQLGIPSRSGVPALHELLLGTHEVKDGQGRRVQVTPNKATGQIDVRAIHHATDVDLPDGGRARQILIDERDRDQLPKIIQRERKRHGLPPLSDVELAAEIAKFATNVTEVVNPEVNVQKTFRFEFVRHGLLKIVYELAFLWLGEAYLDDPHAAKIRAAVMADDPNSTDEIPGYMGLNEECDAFNRIWNPHPAHHLAYAIATPTHIRVCARVFDIYAAAVPVTENPWRYLGGANDMNKLRFMAMDAVSGTQHGTSFYEEVKRLNALMASKNNSSPCDDPLV
jgi:hypothetical protein